MPATTPPGQLPAASANQLKAARRLLRRKNRAADRRFLVEGRQAVFEALVASAPVSLVLLTPAAADRHSELVTFALERGIECRSIDDQGLRSVSDAVTPAGVIGLCDRVDVQPSTAVPGQARLVAYGSKIRDPGNAGTVIRCADAAGADAVILSSGSVDLYNPKTVRASTGSIFHLPVAVGADSAQVINDCRQRGFQVLAASGSGSVRLDELNRDGRLSRPTLWLFGNEAHGLDPDQLMLADRQVCVPIYGRAESLNLATASAVCLYASAFALHAAGR